MENSSNSRTYIILGIGLVILLGLAAWYQWGSGSQTHYFPVVAGETVTSWNYQGAYTGKPELEAKAKAEIDRLNGLFQEEGHTDYILYVSIANQYELLGDGKNAYDTLRKAIAVDPDKTGLAWHNMGKLMERLGAMRTARIAYDNMVKAQPLFQYQEVRLEFLKINFPEDKEAIAEAEALLKATIGEIILE